jgi:methyl-accepting chemotaxis protein
MKDGDRITGYLSVRTQPERAAVQAAQTLYARMRDEAGAGRRLLVLDRGRVLRTDLAGRTARWLQLGPRGQFMLLQAACAAVPGLVFEFAGHWGWAALPVAAGLAAWGSWRLAFGPLKAVLADAHQLASGNLAHTITTGANGVAGDLQQALMQLSVNLRTVTSDTRLEIGNVRNAAQEIAAGNRDLSERTESQASCLEQTAASMEEINTTVRQSADAASRGAEQAAQMAGVTRDGHGSVLAVAETMGSIATSSRRIEDIIKTVEDVAFQTNILALNAAVEAARAGEAGRGFAVVASEVRSLAHRASGAAKEIKALIMESAERVADGNHKVGDAHDRMRHPVSTPRRFEHELSAAMEGRVVGFAVGPGAPVDTQPGAREDAYGMGMVAASRPGLGVHVGGPGVGMTRVVGHAGQCCAQPVVAGPTKRHGFGLARGVGNGRDTGLCGQVFVTVEVLAHAAQLGQDLRGADAPGARETHQDAAIVDRADVVLDAAGQQADLIDQAIQGARQAQRQLAFGFHLQFAQSDGWGLVQPVQQFLRAAPATVGVLGAERGHALGPKPACGLRGRVAHDEGQADGRVHVGEDLGGAGPERLQQAAQLVGQL